MHLYGRPAAIPDLGVPVLEDAAQAHGAARPRIGLRGRGAYSFYPTKNLGGIGDGGAVVTDDDELAATLRLLRAHGLTDDYVHTRVSTNSRLSEVAAAALRRRAAAARGRATRAGGRSRRAYRAAAPELRWQAAHERHVYHLCVARLADRAAFRARVAVRHRRALPAGAHPAARVPGVRAGRRARKRKRWAAECVSFPCFPEMTDDEIEAVCRAIR